MNTTAATRSGLREHEPPHHHAAHRVAEQPQVVQPVRVGDRHARRRPGGRASRRAASSGWSLSPCPRWSNVTTRWSTREGVDVVGEVLLGAADPVHQEQPGRLRIGPPTTVARPTPSSVVDAASRPIYDAGANSR